MKSLAYFLGYVALSVIIIGVSREVGENFFIGVIWILFTYYFIHKYRIKIARFFMKLPFPNLVIVVLASLPFMLIEENVNCLQRGCEIVPITIPFLLVYLLIVIFFVSKFKMVNVTKILLIFCAIGVSWEMFLGDATALFLALPPLWMVIIAIWTGISYAYILVIPLTIHILGRIKK